jgi:transcription initiation factor IIE alpha subunit
MKSVQRPRIIHAIMDEPFTAVELAGIVHCHVRTSRMIVAKLYREGKVFIQEWRRVEYNSIPAAAYRYGIGVDAKKPRPMTQAERGRKLRETEDVERKAFRLARQRQLRRKVKRDPLVAVFFGSASK